jgi:hypothetical protein
MGGVRYAQVWVQSRPLSVAYSSALNLFRLIARYLRGPFVLCPWRSLLLACGSQEILPRVHSLYILDQHGSLYT